MGKSGSSYKWVLVSEEWGGMGGKKWEELQVGACLGRMERKIEKKWEQLQVGASLTRMGGKKWEELQVGAVLVSEDVGRSSAVFAQLTSIPPFMNPVNCF